VVIVDEEIVPGHGTLEASNLYELAQVETSPCVHRFWKDMRETIRKRVLLMLLERKVDVSVMRVGRRLGGNILGRVFAVGPFTRAA
jgi:hypothetical protein